MENQTFNVSNYSKGNTPSWAQKVGDAGLAIGAAGAAVLVLPTALPIVLPTAIISVATGMVTVGTLAKFFCKFFGIKTDEQQ